MDSKYKIIVLPSVYNSILEMFDYLIDVYDAREAAKKLFSEWNESLERISHFPYAMPKISHPNTANNKDYRKFFVGNFITIYQIDETNKTLNVLAFRYAPSKLGDLI